MMKEFLDKKRIVFISIIIILAVIAGLYVTYAIDVFVNETNPNEYDMAFSFELSNNVNRQMTVESGKTKIFDIDITNPYTDSVKYGIAYSLVNPTTLPNGVTIAQTNISKNGAQGLIEESSRVTVSIIIVNESTSNITLSFSVINGYKNGGNLITDGKTLVEGVYNVVAPDPRIDNSGANYPALTDNLVPVMYNGTTWVTADVTSSTSTYGWYDYDNKKWANAVLLTSTKRNSLTKDNKGNYTPGQTIGDTETDGVLAFYVWIPRYKYKVWNINKVIGTDTYGAYTKGIDIVFEEEISTTGEITCTYDFSKTATSTVRNEECTNGGDGYYTHPAFTFGNDELTGIWMGKFEISSNTPGATSGGGSSTTLTPRILPNVVSWRSNPLSNQWKVIKDMQVTNNIYGLDTNTTKVDTHMLTNMEWGAVAYLTHSKYGRCTGGDASTCTEVTINNSSSYITGNAGNTISADYASGTTNAYATTNGGLASTTGNIYGIYDMSGGAGEYVIGNVSSGSGSYVYNAVDAGENYTYSGNEKYLTSYAYGTSYNNQTAYNRGRLGDATSEVVLTASSTGAWYSDYAHFAHSSVPWFRRGGYYNDSSDAGVFEFTYYSGWNDGYDTSRGALAVFP